VEYEWRPILVLPQGFDSAFVAQFRQGPVEGIPDLDAAYDMARLAHSELEAYGTGGGQQLDDEEMYVLLRRLRAVLRRLGVDFDPPFRDFNGFYTYWKAKDMSGTGGYAARRNYLTDLFNPVFSRWRH
jgi:hypothetical protein